MDLLPDFMGPQIQQTIIISQYASHQWMAADWSTGQTPCLNKSDSVKFRDSWVKSLVLMLKSAILANISRWDMYGSKLYIYI